MEKVIPIALVLLLIFNFVSCLYAEEILNEETATTDIATENTDKTTDSIDEATNATNQTTKEPEVTERPNKFTKTATFEATVGNAEDYSAALFTIRSLLYDEPLSDPDAEKEAQGIRKQAEKIAAKEGVKNAYTLYYGFIDFIDMFGESTSLGDDMLMSIYSEVHIIDGADIDEEYENSIFVAMQLACVSGDFTYVSNPSFKNGILTLNIDYEAMDSGDDWVGERNCVIELDKSLLGGEKITEVEFLFKGDLFFPFG